jgi:predicted site-specific integrase-resolvase
MANILNEILSLKHLFEKYGLMNISTYAKKNGVSRMTIYRRIEANQIDYITLGGIKYIVSNNEIRRSA